MMTVVFKNQDNTVCYGARRSWGQASPPEENKTAGNDREEIDKGENGLAAAAVIYEYGYENYVADDLGIGKSGITSDELQDQRRTYCIKVDAGYKRGDIMVGRGDYLVFGGLQEQVDA